MEYCWMNTPQLAQHSNTRLSSYGCKYSLCDYRSICMQWVVSPAYGGPLYAKIAEYILDHHQSGNSFISSIATGKNLKHKKPLWEFVSEEKKTVKKKLSSQLAVA
jgi:hypothetical protein